MKNTYAYQISWGSLRRAFFLVIENATVHKSEITVDNLASTQYIVFIKGLLHKKEEVA